MLEMMQEIGKSSTKGTCCTNWYAQTGLETRDQKALRATHGLQRFQMPGKSSMWANSLRRAHVNENPVSAEQNEDDELPGEKNQWCALLDASYHHTVRSVLLQYIGKYQYSKPISHVHVRHLHCTSYPELIDESKWFPFS